MKHVLGLLICIFASLAATAQEIIGRVIDEKSQPIAYANVVLLNRMDSAFVAGTVTKADGTFSIAAECNDGLLRISYVGYGIKYVEACLGNIGDIQMQIDTKALGEIIVKGYRPIVRQEHEKTIFDLKHIPKVEALKAMDVMKYAPGVVVMPSGDIYVAGKSATVFVNDRQLSDDELKAYMNSLRASDIERIEVMQNHGGVKEASIEGGVVNIITKKKTGVNGTADIYASTPASGYYDLTPSANLYFGTERWNLYGAYSYTQDKSKQYAEATNDYLQSDTRHYSVGNYYANLKKHVYRLGAMYNVSPNHVLGIELNGISTSPTTDRGLNAQTYSIEGQSYKGEARQGYTSHSDFYNIVGSYKWNIDDKSSFLRFLFNYNNKGSKSENELNTEYAGLSGYDVNETDVTIADGDNISSTLDLKKNYTNGWSFRAGGKLLSSNRSSLFTATDNLSSVVSSTDWNYRENIYGGYLGASKELGRWYFSGSFRIENTNIKGETSGSGTTKKNYTDWIPYAYASYSTSKEYNYSLSYTRAVYRPPFSLMNGYVNRISDVLYDKGNPNLETELTDIFDFTLSHGRHTLSVKYRHIPKAITEMFEVENGITYHTNVNYGSMSSSTLSYSYSGNLLSWWQSNLYLAGSYTHIPKSYNKTHLLGGLVSWNNRMAWEKVAILSIGLFFTSPTISGNSYQKGYTTLDMSVERSFFKNALTLQIGVNDLLNGSKVRSNNRVPTLNYDIYMKNQTRQVWCSLIYNFSTKTKVNKNRIQNNNAIKDRL